MFVQEISVLSLSLYLPTFYNNEKKLILFPNGKMLNMKNNNLNLQKILKQCKNHTAKWYPVLKNLSKGKKGLHKFSRKLQLKPTFLWVFKVIFTTVGFLYIRYSPLNKCAGNR
jgi:hypothetical protein